MNSSSNFAKQLILLMTVGIVCVPMASKCQELVVDLKKVGNLIQVWQDAHNDKNMQTLGKMYTDEVIFYSEEMSKASCLSVKSKRLKSKRSFRFEITTQPNVIVYSSKIIKTEFVRKVTSGGTTTDYNSYLLLKQVNNDYLIMGEGDQDSDAKANYSPKVGTELKRVRLSGEAFRLMKKR